MEDVSKSFSEYVRYIRRCLKPAWCLATGQSLMDFGEKVREWNPRKMRFWRYICCTSRAHMLMQIKYVINKKEDGPELRLDLVGELPLLVINLEVEIKTSAIREADRAPPSFQIFIPLPDSEIGGCARNDSLTAPAV